MGLRSDVRTVVLEQQVCGQSVHMSSFSVVALAFLSRMQPRFVVRVAVGRCVRGACPLSFCHLTLNHTCL